MSYPSFENPSLIQALCEIRYQPLSNEATGTMLGILVPILTEKYPVFNVIDEAPFKLNVGGQVIGETNNRYKFSSNSHSYVITVKRDSFSLAVNPSELTKYKKEEFYSSLCFEWNRVSEALKIGKITRIGVRYINKLHVDNVTKNSDFFSKDSEYFPKSGLSAGINFANRNEFQIDGTNRFIVTSGSNLLPNQNNKREFLLDIDRIVEGEDFTKETIENKLVTLHKDIESVFFSSITELYEEKMK